MDLRVLRKEYKLPLCILQNAVKLSQHAAMTFPMITKTIKKLICNSSWGIVQAIM